MITSCKSITSTFTPMIHDEYIRNCDRSERDRVEGLLLSRSSCSIYESRQFHVPSWQSVDIVRWQSNIHFIVNIEPLGMMIHLLGLQSHFGHKSKGLKIKKKKKKPNTIIRVQNNKKHRVREIYFHKTHYLIEITERKFLINRVPVRLNGPPGRLQRSQALLSLLVGKFALK